MKKFVLFFINSKYNISIGFFFRPNVLLNNDKMLSNISTIKNEKDKIFYLFNLN